MFQTGFAIWAMIPNKDLDVEEDEDEDNYYYSGRPKEKGVAVEMTPTPPAQQVPFTPRTQAFHTLERKLPLRHG